MLLELKISFLDSIMFQLEIKLWKMMSSFVSIYL